MNKFYKNIEKKKSVFYSASKYLEPYGMPFRIHYYEQSAKVPHHHDFHELVIVSGGRGRHYAMNKSYPINRGDVFVLKPHITHYYDTAENLRLINIMFKINDLDSNKHGLSEIPGYFALFEAEPELREQSAFKGKYTFSNEELAEVMTILGQIGEEKNRKVAGYVFVCMALFQQLIAYICRYYGNTQRKASRKMLKLSLMLKYIDDNFSNEISLDDIASNGNMSISTANRLFHEMFRETPVGYLIKTRISHAIELLRHEDLRVSEIAFRCGYNDSNYFSLQFKKIMGVSPGTFKKTLT